MMNGRVWAFLLVAGVMLVSACADSQNQTYGPQQWQDLSVVVETRPSPVTVGMNEFIVIASHDKNRPGVGMIVSLQVDEKIGWRQAIQDGYTGVYRRAIRVNDPQTDVLAVRLQNSKAEPDEEAEKTLYFKLNPGQ